jgi:CDP-6-deoxy-D-xylo-4-hexulose-3-dehydrase
MALFNRICELLVTERIEFRTGTAGGGNQCRQPYLVENKYTYKTIGDLDNTDHVHDYSLYVGNHVDVTETQIQNLCRSLNNV